MTDEHRRIGVELRRLRLDRGLSLGELSRRLHYDKGYLSRVESGTRRPSADLVRRCDAVLRTDGQLERSFLYRPSTPHDRGDDVLGVLSTDEVGRVAHPDEPISPDAHRARRSAATWTATAGSVAAVLATDRSTYDSFLAVLTLLRHRGRTSPPALVLPSVVTELHALRAVITAAPGTARSRYLLLAAEFAEFAGWMAEDAGHPAGAVEWTRRAATYARASGDADLPAHAMVRLANATMYRGDGRRTVDLARGAQESTAVSARIRGMAALREAQGHALLGDGADCRRALDRGRSLLAQADGLRSALGLHSVTDPSGLIHGWCLFDLGEPARAAEVLSAELGSVPEGSRRSRGRFGVRLALTLAAAGDVDGAAVMAADALAHAVVVDSTTIRVDVRRLVRELARWPRHVALQPIRPIIEDALRPAM